MATYSIYSYYCDETMERYLLLVRKEYVQHVFRTAFRFLLESVSIANIRLMNAVIIVPSEQWHPSFGTGANGIFFKKSFPKAGKGRERGENCSNSTVSGEICHATSIT